MGPLSTHMKDAGIAIRHLRGYIISILQGLEMGWRGYGVVATPTKWANLGLKLLKSEFQLFGGPEFGLFPGGGQCQPAHR